jgi:hypothetical protein
MGSDRTKHCRKMKQRQRSHLGQWKESVTQRDDVMMSVGGEVTLRRGKGGDDVSLTDMNLTKPKNKENPHAVDSVGINGR